METRLGLLPSTQKHTNTDRWISADVPELNEVGINWRIHTPFKHIVSHYAHKRSHLTLVLRSEALTLQPERFATDTSLHPLEIYVPMHKLAV